MNPASPGCPRPLEPNLVLSHQALPPTRQRTAVFPKTARAVLPLRLCEFQLLEDQLYQESVILDAPRLSIGLHLHVGPLRLPLSCHIPPVRTIPPIVAIGIVVVAVRSTTQFEQVEVMVVGPLEPERDDLWRYARALGCGGSGRHVGFCGVLARQWGGGLAVALRAVAAVLVMVV